MVAHTPDVLDTTPSPLPEGTDESALLDAFLSGLLSLVAICLRFRISLGQFRTWLNSPRTQSCLESAADLTAQRERFATSAARQTAIQGFTSIAKAIPPHDPAAPPDLKRDALHARMRESARKAAGQLLKLIQLPITPLTPLIPERGASRPPTNNPPRAPAPPPIRPGDTPAQTSRRAEISPAQLAAVARAMDAREKPLRAMAGR